MTSSMTEDIYTQEDVEHLYEILSEHDSSHCKCGRKLDFGDISWNESASEAGTPFSIVNIQCQRCDLEIKRVFSGYPCTDDIEDILHILETDWP